MTNSKNKQNYIRHRYIELSNDNTNHILYKKNSPDLPFRFCSANFLVYIHIYMENVFKRKKK